MILAGDAGGTKVLLQLSTEGRVLFERRYAAVDYAGLDKVVNAFTTEYAALGGFRGSIERACFGVAGPVSGERVKVTNLPWQIDARELSQTLKIPAVKLVNDFEAAAHGIDALDKDGIVTLQSGSADAQGHRVVLGAGTGFGVAYAIATRNGRVVVAGEGGHIGFSPSDAVQTEFMTDFRESAGRMAVEQVVSGPGLTRLYEFFSRKGGVGSTSPVSSSVAGHDPADVIARARGGMDAAARSALDLFVDAYGAVAGDHALAVLARGGVFICGGIAPAILPELGSGRFLASFAGKGFHAGLMRGIPVHVVRDPCLSLHGARILAEGL